MKYKVVLFFVVSCIVVYELYYLFTQYGTVHFYDILATIACTYYVNEIWLKDEDGKTN